jgi:hypothetical protein
MNDETKSDPNAKRTIWVVTPHHSGDADECWLAADTDEDHHKALKYAQDLLENLWDLHDPASEVPITVTMEQRVIHAEDFPDEE